MFLVISSGNKQYVVKYGQIVALDRLSSEVEVGSTIDIPVLFDSSSQNKSSVKAKVVEHTRGPKKVIFKFKSKSNYKRKYGHRDNLTLVQIEGDFLQASKNLQKTQSKSKSVQASKKNKSQKEASQEKQNSQPQTQSIDTAQKPEN